MRVSLSFVFRVAVYRKRKGRPGAALRPGAGPGQSSGTMSSATMLMILMSGLTAGPAVSL